MPSFITPQNGDDALAEHVAQLTEDFQGLRNIPVSLTGINDAAAYALTVKNAGTGSKDAIMYAADGTTVLLQVDESGVKASASGGAAAPIMTTGSTVGASQLADASITNAKLAADTARANLLTNGGFRIWQRGNGPFSTGYTADRWQIGLGAGASFSVSRVQNGGGPPVDLWAVVLSVAYTHGSTGSSIYQNLLMSDQDLRGRTVTFACWINSSVTTTTQLRLVSNGTAAQDVLVPVTSANTWQRLNATITVPNDATFVYPQLQMGASCTAYMTDAMLVVGSVAADYAPLHPADDLARCQRYCARIDNSNAQVHSPGLATSTTNALGIAQWPVTMAVVPSLTVTGPAGMNVVNSVGTPVTVTALTGDLLSVTGGRLNATTEAYLTAGAATYFTWTAAASILVEANA